jgi:hypothetical protein
MPGVKEYASAHAFHPAEILLPATEKTLTKTTTTLAFSEVHIGCNGIIIHLRWRASISAQEHGRTLSAAKWDRFSELATPSLFCKEGGGEPSITMRIVYRKWNGQKTANFSQERRSFQDVIIIGRTHCESRTRT